jgi:DNA-binding CsgD family transcriptional regulator
MINLTEKEKRIIELKADGHTLKEIARTLATNRQYVFQLVNDLYKKTGVRNGPSLIAWAYKNRVLQN